MRQGVLERTVTLPPVPKDGGMPLERALHARRSVRDFGVRPITVEDLSRLLWAAQGITSVSGGRTAPSAGALYPLEVLALASTVEGLEPGVYRYRPHRHRLVEVRSGDGRAELAIAALEQECVAKSAAVLVVAASFERASDRYGERGRRLVLLEAGHVAQNVQLEAVSLGLGAVIVGLFDDEAVKRAAGLSRAEDPVLLIPVGHPR